VSFVCKVLSKFPSCWYLFNTKDMSFFAKLFQNFLPIVASCVAPTFSLDLCNCKPSSSSLFCYEILEIINSSYIYIYIYIYIMLCRNICTCFHVNNDMMELMEDFWEFEFCSLEFLFTTIVVQWNFYFLATSYGSSLNEDSKRVISTGLSILFFLCQCPIELY
jgi:hypothetical protein